MKLAICFFGHVKNFNDLLYESFIKNIVKPINHNSIDYFLVTYNNKYYFNPSNNENHLIDYKSIFKYFKFNQKIILDINAQYTKNIDNFTNKLIDRYGCSKYWGDYDNAKRLTIYAIRQIYGLYKLYDQVLYNTSYDKYIFCRPDCIFHNKIHQSLIDIPNSICIPNFACWHGYNDRFAITDYNGMIVYCNRYKNLVEKPTIYHAENYLKYTLLQKKINTAIFDGFQFQLLRSDGSLSRPGY